MWRKELHLHVNKQQGFYASRVCGDTTVITVTETDDSEAKIYLVDGALTAIVEAVAKNKDVYNALISELAKCGFNSVEPIIPSESGTVQKG